MCIRDRVNISKMLPVGVLATALSGIVEALTNGTDPRAGLTRFLVAGVLALAALFVTFLIQYKALYEATYLESANRRIRLAEVLRQLPLSFFGNRDLTDLTTTIMGDTETLETVSYTHLDVYKRQANRNGLRSLRRCDAGNYQKPPVRRRSSGDQCGSRFFCCTVRNSVSRRTRHRENMRRLCPVSYTHLDVYKRQSLDRLDNIMDIPSLDENGADLVPENFNIEVKNMSFGYGEKEVDVYKRQVIIYQQYIP